MSEPRDEASRRAVMALGLFYACAYLPVGITLPYLPQHFRSLGLTGARVGMLMAAYPLMSLLVPPAFGFVADRTRRGASLLRLATLFAALSTVPLLFATGEAAIAPWLLLAAFCGAPVSMLADSLTLERLGARAREYPRVRLWGSVGFVVAAAGFGFLYTGERTSPPKVIVAALVGSGLAFLASLFLRGQGVREGKLSLSDAAALLRDRRVRLLFAVTCLHWLANSPYNLLFTVFLKDEGLAPSVAGLGMGVGVVAEVSVMFAFPRIARHLTARRLLAVSFAASALRWALIAVTHAAVPMVLLQFIHGLTFGAFMIACVTLMNDLAPARLRATGQALFVSVTYGLGGVVGYLVVGWLYDLVGSRQLFFGAAGLELVPAVLVMFLSASGVPRQSAAMVGSPEVPP